MYSAGPQEIKDRLGAELGREMTAEDPERPLSAEIA